jgi:hypothetical protein
MEIRNLVTMFELKAFKQAYNLTRLQDNTLSHKHFHNHFKYSSQLSYKLPKPNLIIPGLIPYDQYR